MLTVVRDEGTAPQEEQSSASDSARSSCFFQVLPRRHPVSTYLRADGGSWRLHWVGVCPTKAAKTA